MPNKYTVKGEAQATPKEMLEKGSANLDEIQNILLKQGFSLHESWYVLPQGASCWDNSAQRWKPYKLGHSPLRFVANLEGINYVFMLSNIASSDVILQVWTLHETTTFDGTLRKIQDFGIHLGTYVISIFPDSHWEAQFMLWFKIFHDQIKTLPNPEEAGRCKCCGKITSLREVGAISSVHSIVCADCVKKYSYKMR